MSKTINILLVEDNPGDVRLVECMLMESTNQQYRCSNSPTITDAINEIANTDYDVVLLDMSLPDGDGIDNITQIKSRAPTLPIVVMTGRQDEAFALEAVRAGAEDYLIKGQIDFWQLSRALNYAIERKNLQERITHMANHDQLTGLANRSLFSIRFDHALSWAGRRDESVALLYIDLDHFKSINDELGHAIGDGLLCQVANRLLETVREIDTVCRLGGDEFIILLEAIQQNYDVAAVASKLIENINKPFTIGMTELHVGCSIGISIYPHSGKDTDTLISNADTALYKAKAKGRNQYQFYDLEMNQQALSHLNVYADLRRALEKQEFVLHYQPKFALNSQQVSGYEALLRWQHPQSGVIKPSQFIPLLEKNGLISEVGKWVLDSACKQQLEWQKSGLAVGKMAVNLSGRQLAQKGFSEMVAKVLSTNGISPGSIELELTETLLIQNTGTIMSIMDSLKAMGVSIAIDDFGTGYNSFGYLKEFLVDTLKIDQSFIQGITHQACEAAITSAIISLSNDLGINVVAEGVETLEQLKFLQDKNIDEIQGFYFSPPVNSKKMEDILIQQQATKDMDCIYNY